MESSSLSSGIHLCMFLMVTVRSTQHEANLCSFAEICDFGSDNDLNTCDWTNRNGSTLQWQTGSGSLSNWLGGPSRDSGTGDDAVKGTDVVL
jgi:hypothetical protein